jgi:hypothetical protein
MYEKAKVRGNRKQWQNHGDGASVLNDIAFT